MDEGSVMDFSISFRMHKLWLLKSGVFMYLVAELHLKRVSIFEGSRDFGDCTAPSRTDLRKGSCEG